MRSFVVAARDGGLPLERVLPRLVTTLTPATAAALIRAGQVFVDGHREPDPSRRLSPGLRIVLHDRAPSAAPSPRVLFEDDCIVVLDKRPGEHLNETETSVERALIEVLRGREPDARVVHRLDRETSGLVVVAKERRTAEALSEAFRDRRVEKTYAAVIEDRAVPTQVDAPIALDPRRPRARRVGSLGAGAEAAETRFVCGAAVGGLKFVRAEPRTGRTHQIRVHLSHSGAPILGDRLYGGLMAVRLGGGIHHPPRTLLHAARLVLPGWPAFELALPEDFQPFLQAGLSWPT